jgi:hypothetical protein
VTIGTAPFVTALTLSAGLLAAACPASAEAASGTGFAPCKPWRDVLTDLGSRYAERPVAFGLANGSLLQVFASERTGTWTLVTMHPNGTACLIGAGSSWETLPGPSTDPAA